MPMPTRNNCEQFCDWLDTAQIIPFLYGFFSSLLFGNCFSFIPYGCQFFPVFPAFKPLDFVCDHVFSCDDIVGRFFGFLEILPLLCLNFFQEFFTGKIFFYLKVCGFLVFLQGKAVIPMCLFYDGFCCCFLCIHRIRSHHTASAVELFHDLPHFRNLIAFFVNSCGRKVDSPFRWHHIKLIEVASFCGIFAVFFAGIVSFFSIRRNHISDITAQLIIFIKIFIQLFTSHCDNPYQDIYQHTL